MAGKFDLGWQWDGLRITIISDKNHIYANSIVNPSMQSNPFSRGWNRKNLQVFKDNLIAAAKGEDVVKAAEEKALEQEFQLENESEWTLGNTGKRIIGYFFALALLGVCGLILAEGFNLVFILLGALCVGYLVLDVVIIVKKMNKG